MSGLDHLKPMLLVERPLNLDESGWIYELKFDGYRLMAEFGDGRCKLKTGDGEDATKWFPEVFESLAGVTGGPHITDGEVCVLDEKGCSNFDQLQDRAHNRHRNPGADPVTYCVFDLLRNGAVGLMSLPLVHRKARLAKLFTPRPSTVLVVDHWDGDAKVLFQAAQQLKLEGIVAKRADSVYSPGARSSDWVKLKRKGAEQAERSKRR